MQNRPQDTRSWWKKLCDFFCRKHTATIETPPQNEQPPQNAEHEWFPIRPAEYAPLQELLGYQFHDLALLRQSLTHRSFVNESGNSMFEDNEKLEFLGDSIIGMVISDFLYRSFLHFREGDLSRVKSHVVSEPFLAQLARELDLGMFLVLGKGEAASGGHDKNSLLSNCYEAVVAAIYLDGGIQAVWDFLLRCFKARIEILVNDQHILDHKSLFQEYAQKLFNCTPIYKLRQITGPEHDKSFEVELIIKGETFSAGGGKNKKEAEQAAAKAALSKINVKKTK